MQDKGTRGFDIKHVDYNKIVHLLEVPHGLDEINKFYGKALDNNGEPYPGFSNKNLKAFKLSFPMRLSWKKSDFIERVYCHYLIGPALVDALEEIVAYRGYDYLKRNNLDLYGGCYNPRPKTGGTDPSTHAWGIAIDINPDHGAFGKPSSMPDFIVQAFKKRGFIWGGDWDMRWRDGMHFQACSGY